ncbi:MAG: 2Fe-2S iron-sulfur cluster binding domain-containing protein [Bryobacteraceae bacterium]|nr:2Fe-2S iron-sulfur cluster binding domain-containing protein [Bryobacteraceae bacterium]
MSSTKDTEKPEKKSRFSRRGFLQGVSVGGGALSTGILTPEAHAQSTPAGVISGETPVTLTINGKPYKTSVEPRMTLLDVMRNSFDLTAAKRVCDRGTCGACTVIVDAKAVYACTMLAIDAQGRQIQSLEGLSNGNSRHPIIDAFVNNDAQQCGYCTPGFVMASKAFLDHNPKPTIQDVKEGLGGNLCRCGTYMGIRKAVVEASTQLKGGKVNA